MKRMKKMLAFLLTFSMMAAISLTVLAQTKSLGNGPATITVQNTTPEKEYVVKKVFEASADSNGNIAYYKLDTNGNRITSAADMPSGFSDWFDVDSAGNITAKLAAHSQSDADSMELSSGAIEWLKENGTTVSGSEVTANADGTLQYTGLEYGYYVVTSSLGAAVTVTSTNPNATIIDKNQESTWDGGKKFATSSDATEEEYVDISDLSIGTTVYFELPINAVNYEGTNQVKEYLIHDTMPEGLTYGEIVSVTVKKSDDAEHTLAQGTDYTYTAPDGDKTFTIVIPWATSGTDNNGNTVWTSKYTATAKISVKYSAVLNDKAKVGNNANENKAQFEPVYTDGTVNGEKPESKTKIYTTSITILKQDDSGSTLTGAEFTLAGSGAKWVVTTGEVYTVDDNGTYYKLKDGTYTTTAPTGATEDRYDSTTIKYKKETQTTVKPEGTAATEASAFVGEDGKVTFAGLCAGTYTLSETVVPAGYNKAKDITVTITAQESGQGADKTVDFSATAKDSDNNDVDVSEFNEIFSITVVNNKGVVLPSTGGTGTTLFYIIGSILVIGAGIVLVAKRRMSVR